MPCKVTVGSTEKPSDHSAASTISSVSLQRLCSYSLHFKFAQKNLENNFLKESNYFFTNAQLLVN